MTTRPRFTLAQLQYFVAAAEAGNITAAAAALHTSQSGMSTAIQRLERDLGCELFIRHHARGISLTPDGRALLSRAQDLLTDAGALQDLGRRLQGTTGGDLSVGVYVTLAPYFVPRVLTGLRSAHPDLHVDVLESHGTTLQEAVRSGDCAVALTYGLDIADDLLFTPLVHLAPYALVPAGHEVTSAEAGLDELATMPMAMLDLPELSRYMLGMFTTSGLPTPEIIRTTSFETMQALVAAGDGFAMLNRRPVPSTGDGSMRVVRIRHAPPIPIGLLRAAASTPNRRVQAFAEQCRAAGASLVDVPPAT